MGRVFAPIAAAAILLALGWLCVTLARAFAFGFDAKDAKSIARAGALVGVAGVVFCCVAIRIGLVAAVCRWREGVDRANRLRSQLESECEQVIRRSKDTTT